MSVYFVIYLTKLFHYRASNKRVNQANNELERMWKEAVVTYFPIIQTLQFSTYIPSPVLTDSMEQSLF
jgi:heme/copper-type cytochrome/quinol oxidase subunit 2